MDLIGIARNPIPPDPVSGYFTAKDGAKLRFACWKAAGETRLGTICLFGGRTEFIEKYFEVIADLRRRGFAVATLDWRGQGLSHRELRNRFKGHIRNFRQFDDDLTDFMQSIVLPDCPPPYYALAHSMGGHILLRNARKRNSWFERMVLVAPMIELSRSTLGTSQSNARYFAELAGFFGFAKKYAPGGKDHIWTEADAPFEGNVLTSDADRYARHLAIMDAEPNLALGAPTIGWLRAACRSMAEFAQPGFAETVHVPMLIVGAGSDKVVSTRAIEKLATELKIGSGIIIPRSRHEILQESDDLRQQFWAVFDAFVLGES